ncbi:MAG: heme ABC exporter ATP-binding protein CcmA [Nitrospinae bacterium]|nr:heme ABC exporter ATP-binding protein CcmA [Nitrospinota bacterium]
MLDYAIETHRLTKRFGPRPVLRGIDLTVKRGEFVVLFGPNGAGKSTLIRILCTLMRPSGGTAKVAGCDLAEDPDGVRLGIGLIGHSTHLYDDLTADENLRFYLRMRGASQVEQRTRDALQATGLERVAHGRVRTFSAGMKKRLCIARIIAHPPSVLFLDEPYSGLDAQGIEMLNRFLRSLKTEGCTLFMATHHREQGLATGDRALYLCSGQLCTEPCSSGDA